MVISGTTATTGFVVSTGAFLAIFEAGLGFLGIALVVTAVTDCSDLTSVIAISGVASTGLGATTSAFLGVFMAGLGFLGGALVRLRSQQAVQLLLLALAFRGWFWMFS
jgi:hypothetical protein